MTNKQEILNIITLAMDISDISPDTPINACANGAVGVSVTVFKNLIDIDWNVNLYEWSHDECYPAKLRFIRNRLEQMYKEALAQRQEMVA